MSITVDVPVKAEVKIYDVCVGDYNYDLEFKARVDCDGDIRIQVSEESFIRIAKEQFGLEEPSDE